jgi:hypothetical protein
MLDIVLRALWIKTELWKSLLGSMRETEYVYGVCIRF